MEIMTTGNGKVIFTYFNAPNTQSRIYVQYL